MPGGLSYDRRIKNDLRRSVQDGLLGLDVEEMDLVGIEGNANLVSVACLGGGSDAGGHLIALVLPTPNNANNNKTTTPK